MGLKPGSTHRLKPIRTAASAGGLSREFTSVGGIPAGRPGVIELQSGRHLSANLRHYHVVGEARMPYSSMRTAHFAMAALLSLALLSSIPGIRVRYVFEWQLPAARPDPHCIPDERPAVLRVDPRAGGVFRNARFATDAALTAAIERWYVWRPDKLIYVTYSAEATWQRVIHAGSLARRGGAYVLVLGEPTGCLPRFRF